MSFENIQKHKVDMSKMDRLVLSGYNRLAESIADLIGPHCEIAVHSFENFENSVVKIVNGHHTGRKAGAPITDLGLKILSHYKKTGDLNPPSYFTKNKDNNLLKSTSCLFVGEEKKPIGMFCININLSRPFPEIIETLIPSNQNHSENEDFSSSATDIIERSIVHAIHDIEKDPSKNSKQRNKEIVKSLFNSGIYEFKDAISISSDHLGISRHAIYKYLRELKL